MDEDDEPSAWVSTLKVVLAAAVLIGTIGLALWYASQLPESSPALEQAIEAAGQKSSSTGSSPDRSWGIAKDSPLRR